MIESIFYILLAGLGLGFLIFIHELGHFWMARRVGMKVEAFGIGFGKPIYSWERDGVQWRLCWLPFGGYVKIAGMETPDDPDAPQKPDSYYAKSPLDRIKVAIMGPLVNLVFAFLLFAILWTTGGREKNYSEYSRVLGWVDPHSELFAQGIRPGDIVSSYDDQEIQSFKDHLYGPMTAGEMLKVNGYKVNYQNSEKVPFSYNVKVYPHPNAIDKDFKTVGVIDTAGYVIYNRLVNGQDNPLPEGSPLKDSGIQYGDRIFWVDGEMIFSDQQLSHVINDQRSLLTIKRGDKTLLRRVPRVPVLELKLDPIFKEELADWQYEANLSPTKAKVYAIPYDISADNVIEKPLKFIDPEHQESAFSKIPFSEAEENLLPGDKILAVDGTPVKYPYQVLYQLQQHKVSIIVERDPQLLKTIPWNEAADNYNSEVKWSDANKIAESIGTANNIKESGNLFLLNPVIPKMRGEFALSPETKARFASELLERRKQIEDLEDPEKRAQALQALDQQEKLLVLGLPAYQDRKVQYNPNPIQQFVGVFDEIFHTLKALVSGYLNPKWMSGPLGIVQVVHDSWKTSIKDAIFWIGAISMNLGVLNLLPIPVLDGGYICISLFEIITRKKVKPKTIERLVIPFAILLIAFLVFLTYNDILRLAGRFVGWGA